MRIKMQSGDIEIETEHGIFEVCSREEGLVICSDNKSEDVMNIRKTYRGKESVLKASIMWIHIERKKK